MRSAIETLVLRVLKNLALRVALVNVKNKTK